MFMYTPMCLSLLNEEETTTSAFRSYLLYFTIAVCNCDAIYIYIYIYIYIIYILSQILFIHIHS